MCSMLFYWSIVIHAALVIVFGITEFPLSGSSLPSNESCVNVSGEIICYFKGNEEPAEWDKARRLCNSFNSLLPVIRNGNDQDALAGYLESHAGNTAAWTAGKKAQYDTWAWRTGEQFDKNDQAEPKDVIEYTNWDDNQYAKEGDCISIGISDGKWKALGCNEKHIVVCQKVLLKEGTKYGSRGSLPQSSEASTESITHGSQDSTLQSLWFLILVAAIVIIICLIVFVLKTKIRSVLEICSFKFNYRYPRSNREELHSRTANAYAIETSVNEHGYVNPAIAAVERSDDIRDDYEEISSLQLNQSEDGATEKQPGNNDASLAKETNLEPDQKCAHPTSPTKIGPLGDIYAMPEANVRSGIVSGANNRPNHPIKVTAQGDVYALPMQRSKSSTSNNPGEVVYVNLPTAERLGKEEAAEAHVQTNASSNATSSCETAANGRYQDLETT